VVVWPMKKKRKKRGPYLWGAAEAAETSTRSETSLDGERPGPNCGTPLGPRPNRAVGGDLSGATTYRGSSARSAQNATHSAWALALVPIGAGRVLVGHPRKRASAATANPLTQTAGPARGHEISTVNWWWVDLSTTACQPMGRRLPDWVILRNHLVRHQSRVGGPCLSVSLSSLFAG